MLPVCTTLVVPPSQSNLIQSGKELITFGLTWVLKSHCLRLSGMLLTTTDNYELPSLCDIILTLYNKEQSGSLTWSNMIF